MEGEDEIHIHLSVVQAGGDGEDLEHLAAVDVGGDDAVHCILKISMTKLYQVLAKLYLNYILFLEIMSLFCHFYHFLKEEVIDRDPGPGVPVNDSLLTGTLSNVHRCWMAMPLGAGVLSWVLACHTIEKQNESKIYLI